jgi:hypothetical protein
MKVPSGFLTKVSKSPVGDIGAAGAESVSGDTAIGVEAEHGTQLVEEEDGVGMDPVVAHDGIELGA